MFGVPMKIILALITMFSALHANANENTCSHYLRTQFAKRMCLGISCASTTVATNVYGAGTSIKLFKSSHRLRKDAQLLKSAHILRDKVNYSASEIRDAKREVGYFAKHTLRREFPRTTLSRTKIIDALEDLNINGMNNGFCKNLYDGTEYKGITNSLFKNGNLDSYNAFKKGSNEI